MIYEIAGSRVLGPYLGTSIFIWTSLIGIILGSLSIGYWLGGRLADKNPTFRALARIILLAAFFILLTTLLKEFFLAHLPRIISGLKWQSVIASIILFAPASIFLGMVSPYSVRLKIKALQTSGTTVGNLYAISTVGSIAGTFAAGFFLIPWLGTTNILFTITVLLALLSIILFLPTNKKTDTFPAILLLLATGMLFLNTTTKAKTYIDLDTQYSRVWIYNSTDQATGKPIRFMRINNESSSAMFLENDDLVFDYARYYRLAEHFTPGFTSTLILGGAAFSYPKYFLEMYPDATMDVVEIDPELTEMARKHFRLRDNPRMRIFHEDARTYMNHCTQKYDVIYGDAYKSLYTIPWHLTTREAAQKTYDMLNDGGCVLLNIISSIRGNSSLFLQAELATYKDVFPFVRVFAVMDPGKPEEVQSMILLAVKSENIPSGKSVDPELSRYLENDVTELVPKDMPVLTDEFAPVDFYTNRAIK